MLALNNIGLCFKKLGDYEHALELYLKSVEANKILKKGIHPEISI